MEGPGKNALGTEMLRHLRASLRAADGAPVLLTGAGDAFSAGLNLKEVAAADEAAMLAFLRLLEDTVTDWFLYPGPTVAAVNGHAIAGGCVMALCCDHRVMTSAPKAKIGLNETALGVRFPPRTFAAIRQRLPRQHERRIVLGAELFDAATARDLGLIDEVAEDVMAAAKKRLSTLAGYPASAYALAKADLHGKSGSDLVPDDEQDRRLREAAQLWAGSAVRQMLSAALAR